MRAAEHSTSDPSALIERSLAGDADAWRTLIDLTAPVVAAAVRRRSGPATPQTDIDDRIQEVYVRLLDRDGALLRSWDAAKSSLSTWVSLISHSVCIDAARRGARRSGQTSPLSAVSANGTAGEGCPHSDHVTDGLRALVESLPPRQRLIVELVVARGLDVAAVASWLGVEPQTVRSLKHKALSALRKRVEADDTGDQPSGMPDRVQSYNPAGADS